MAVPLRRNVILLVHYRPERARGKISRQDRLMPVLGHAAMLLRHSSDSRKRFLPARGDFLRFARSNQRLGKEGSHG